MVEAASPAPLSMLYYLIAAALIVHTCFWGLGLAWLVVPRAWRRWWWALAPGLGLALQSAVVWVGAHTTLVGTKTYALGSELLPLALLVVAAWRAGPAALLRWVDGWWGMRGLLPLAVVAGWALLWPMAQRGAWTLTSSSLGSCDHADYAAGARVFQEFSKDDRIGFLGQPEVTQVGSAETFFDFWLRLNHFTPSALLAHNGAVLGLQGHQLVSLSGVVILVLNGLLILLLGRAALGLRGIAGLVPAVIYLFSPLGAYAVHHGALGQLYAAQGTALLTLAVIAAGRGRRPWAWAPMVLAACWLLAGSYNFILTVALAPAVAWLLAEAWRRRDWRGPARVLVMVLTMLAACAGLFWGRFDGLRERFALFERYDFGWPVPLLSPEGWLGLLRDTGLDAWPLPMRLALSAIVLTVTVAGIALLWRRRQAAALAALALVLPVLVGWALLAGESQIRANASYDAFKLFSVFYPGLIVGVAGSLTALGEAGRAVWRRATAATVVLVLAGNVYTAVLFARQMARPPLRVDRALLELRRLEAMPQVTSLNMQIEKFWSRLWANAFLLRKPQYFATHTYEGRLDTELKGEWDLSDNLLHTVPLAADDLIRVNEVFHAVRVAAPGRLRAEFASGWHAAEGRGADRWRWSEGSGRIVVNNPSARPVEAQLAVRVRALAPGPLELRLEQHSAGVRAMDGSLEEVVFDRLLFQPGNTVVTLAGPAGAAPGGGDNRRLSFALHAFELRALALGK